MSRHLRNTRQVEWGTPAYIIERVHRAMGGIDVDPASTARYNDTVRARTFHTARDNGLIHEWRGRVFLNPPYRTGAQGVQAFTAKLVEERRSGRATQAVLLCNNCTETKWFQHVLNSEPVLLCFPHKRIQFIRPDDSTGSPLQGQALVGLGVPEAAFGEAFQDLGWVGQPLLLDSKIAR